MKTAKIAQDRVFFQKDAFIPLQDIFKRGHSRIVIFSDKGAQMWLVEYTTKDF